MLVVVIGSHIGNGGAVVLNVGLVGVLVSVGVGVIVAVMRIM